MDEEILERVMLGQGTLARKQGNMRRVREGAGEGDREERKGTAPISLSFPFLPLSLPPSFPSTLSIPSTPTVPDEALGTFLSAFTEIFH